MIEVDFVNSGGVTRTIEGDLRSVCIEVEAQIRRGEFKIRRILTDNRQDALRLADYIADVMREIANDHRHGNVGAVTPRC